MPEIRNYAVTFWPQHLVQTRLPEIIRDHYQYIEQAIEEKLSGA